MSPAAHWVWVFGEIAGLRWVTEHEIMAFPKAARRRIREMGRGDRAVLYVTRGAFHNPTRDEARLGGLATVLGDPQRGQVVDRRSRVRLDGTDSERHVASGENRSSGENLPARARARQATGGLGPVFPWQSRTNLWSRL